MIFHTNVHYLIPYQLTILQCHTFFSSQDIKQNVLLSSYLDNCWSHKQGKNEGKTEKQKNWISRERKELFRWKLLLKPGPGP